MRKGAYGLDHSAGVGVGSFTTCALVAKYPDWSNAKAKRIFRRQNFIVGKMISVGQDSLVERRNAIRDLVSLITKYHGDFNDVLIVEALTALRS